MSTRVSRSFFNQALFSVKVSLEVRLVCNKADGNRKTDQLERSPSEAISDIFKYSGIENK